ncbi:histidine kinase [Parabacteroides sp. PF5-9]|uniref:sensor histidine kinase n=1 Tax=Parabacteroides sp. PF5-9 TaxID=1742404 RepID=UPI002474CF01|nr:histidine kinase [Parabacteroides sp. PF5-9]MDH6358489.1 two-component system LytT family sensor kinase [Parabacteroides sp. PF5-9]
MQEHHHNNIIIRLLVSPRLRILRHLFLVLFTSSIAAGITWFMLEERETMTTLQKYGSLFLFTSLFLGGCYLSIYLLTPRLLLKNRWGTYLCSVMGIVLGIMIVSVLVEMLLGNEGETVEETSIILGIISFMSSFLSLTLLFVGTSALVLFKYWIQDMQQAEELESATLQSELKLLENQINPHFLFNMLNNANIMIKSNPDMAIHIIARLEDMLHYQMNDSSRKEVTLKEEIVFLNDYLELEKTRRDYFNYTITKEGEPDHIQIPPLLFITFVENAVKHNQDSRTASYVYLLFRKSAGKLTFICENSIPRKSPEKEVGGIGLTNAKRRLDLLFKDNYRLEQTKTDTNYTVKLEFRL